MKRVKMKSSLVRIALALSLCLSLILPFEGMANAATNSTSTSTSTSTSSGSAAAADVLKISPVETEVTIDRGGTSVVKTYVTNTTKTTIDVEPVENDFVAGNSENGTPYLILGANSYASVHSLKRFMQPLPTTVPIAPGQDKEIDLTIDVPNSAQAGGYYGAIRFTSGGADASKSVSLSPSAATLILLTVPGNLVEKLALQNFNIEQDGSSKANFRNSKNLSLEFSFKNEGNIHESPFGQIYVKKGVKVVYSDNFNQNQPQQVVLPDSSRQWTQHLKGIGGFGKYTIGATFTYGSKGASIQITKTIWIVPLGYIIAGIAVIVGVILLVSIIITFLRTYKRRILRKANQQNNRNDNPPNNNHHNQPPSNNPPSASNPHANNNPQASHNPHPPVNPNNSEANHDISPHSPNDDIRDRLRRQ
jgi:hypothetical protein